MSPGEREFGRLEGKVDGIDRQVRGLEGRLDHMAETSSAEHADVRSDLRRLGDDIRAIAEAHDKRFKPLETASAEGRGRAAAIRIGQGFAFALVPVLLYFLDQVLNQGGVR